jgi:hypothetical protein|tara:strand:- start:757 stop:1065 length:309 start_codon:yes stop_codon:yes gene_type:complete
MKTKIHINQHVIKSNHKNNKRDPVITVKTYNSNNYGHQVDILGPSKVIYSPDKPLSCGAKVWIETDSEVIVIPDIPYRKRKEKKNVKKNKPYCKTITSSTIS